MRTTTTFQGTISGKTLTVASLASGAILEGQVIASGAAAGTTIVKSLTGNGGNGDYVVSISQTIGSATAMTIAATQVASVSDLKGGFTLTAGSDNEGPRLMTDALGRKFLRFIMPVAYNGSWLQNLTITGIDTYNLTTVMVARVHVIDQQALFSAGSSQLGTSPGNDHMSISSSGHIGILSNNIDYNGGSPPANINKLYAGCQLQALGAAIATDDGIGGAGGARTCRVGVNEQSAAVQNNTAGRSINVNGMEVGKRSSQNPGGGGVVYAYIDLYELALWSTGQMGNQAAMPANFDAAMAAAQANFGILNITDSLIFAGDSRSVNGASVQSGSGADGSGYNIATIIAEPSSGLPASTRVLNVAAPGQGIGYMGNLFDHKVDGNNRSTPFMASMMLGGGHDRVHFFSGINDMDGALWPTDNFAASTTGQADEMYGTNRTATLLATVSNNDNNLTATTVVGKIGVGSQFSFTNANAGLGSTSNGASPFSLNQYQSPAVTAAAATATLYSYKGLVERLLTRGFKVTWAAEIAYGLPESAGTVELRSKIAGAVADVTADIGSTLAANLRVYNPALITVGGQAVMGANFVGATQTNTIYVDGTHQTANGKRVFVTGGDTPANGVLANV